MPNPRIPVIGFVAPSGSGKTTLLRKLVPVLTGRGLRLGYLKHAHHTFDLDTPGKDSYAIREAGAVQTLLASRERWALQCERPDRGEDPVLAEMLALFDPARVDLILAEGFKHAAYPKIEIHRPTLGKAPLYPGDPDILAVACDGQLPGDHPPELPLADPEAIAEFVLQWLAAAPPISDLGGALVQAYAQLRRYGYNDSHSGNASVRDRDGFWVTPAGAGADSLHPEDLVLCPLEGPCPEGASSDALVHQAVYRERPEARALLHSHGPHTVAMSFAGQDFRPSDYGGQVHFPSVPVLSVPFEEHREKAPGAVAEALAGNPVAIVRGHGAYAWGRTLEEAYKWTSALERSARIYVIARQAVSI